MLWKVKQDMRKIPETLRHQMENDPYYRVCSRKNRDCDGRITWEHAIIYAGKQLNEKWAIIPLCEYHHAVNRHQDGGELNKEINVMIALNRATDQELLAISKVENYKRKRDYLNNKYDQRN
jgi:hypothetical protein